MAARDAICSRTSLTVSRGITKCVGSFYYAENKLQILVLFTSLVQYIGWFDWFWLIELGFNDTSTLVGHFVSSPREREKIDRRDSRRDEREGQGRKRNRNESEETEERKNITSLPLPATRIAGLAQLSANISWTPRVTKDTWHLRTTQPPTIGWFACLPCFPYKMNEDGY